MSFSSLGSAFAVFVAFVALIGAGCNRESPATSRPAMTTSSSNSVINIESDASPATRSCSSSTTTSSATIPKRLASTSTPRALSEMRVTHGEILVSGAPAAASQESATASATKGGSPMNLRVEHPVVRAVLETKTSQDVDLHFTYNGPTSPRVALGSGEQRVQIGVKLRAADGCNVVYAMLRLVDEAMTKGLRSPRSPTNPSLVVQVKHNPDSHTHDDCGASGYRTIKPDVHTPIRAIAIGSTHELRASMNGERLRVWLDRTLVWSGDVGPDALTFDGPVGFRTDNGRFDIALLAGVAPSE